MQIIKLVILSLVLGTYVSSVGQSKEIKVGSEQTKVSPVENRYAFIIGIDHYKDPDIQNFTSCRIDAVKFEAYLKSDKGWKMPAKNIVPLLDPKKEKIITSFVNFLDGIKSPKTATVYFYYSGHGVRGSIVPSDYFIDEPQNLISYDYIKREIDKRGVQSKVFILDACYSGSIITMKGDGDFNSNYAEFIQDNDKESNQVTFTATTSNRTTPAGKNVSVFTHYLLKALEEKASDTNNDMVLSAGELYDALSKELHTSNPPQFAGSRNFPMASFKPYLPQVTNTVSTSNIIKDKVTPNEYIDPDWNDKYDYVMPFGSGYSIHRNGFIGYADGQGKEVIPAIYKGFTEPFNGYSVVSKGLKKYGAVNMNGKIVVPIEYEEIDGFGEGLFSLKKNGKWGYINLQLQTVIPFTYLDAKIFSCGVAATKNGSGWGFIDKQNETVIPHTYEDALDCQTGNLLPVNKDGKWGIIGIDESEKIPFIFDDFKEFSEGLAAAQKYGKWGFINTYGKVVIDYKYNEAYFFTDNLAEVELDNKTFFINRDGNCVKDCE